MAIFRKVHTSFWSDPFTSELDSDLKLFYLYLITNERTKQCGIYEITKRQISFDLKCSIDTVSKHLKYFISKGKIKYNDVTNELAIKNWMKYNDSTSPKVKTCINKEFEAIKDKVLIQYLYSIDTKSQEEKEPEEEKEKEPEFILIFPFESDNFKNIWSRFIEFRKSIKKPLKEISQQAQLKKLSEYSEGVACEMILQSIANGWQGIFEVKKNNNNGKQTIIDKQRAVADSILNAGKTFDY